MLCGKCPVVPKGVVAPVQKEGRPWVTQSSGGPCPEAAEVATVPKRTPKLLQHRVAKAVEACAPKRRGPCPKVAVACAPKRRKPVPQSNGGPSIAQVAEAPAANHQRARASQCDTGTFPKAAVDPTAKHQGPLLRKRQGLGSPKVGQAPAPTRHRPWRCPSGGGPCPKAAKATSPKTAESQFQSNGGAFAPKRWRPLRVAPATK